jgi:fused signal recognition particle receptor
VALVRRKRAAIPEPKTPLSQAEIERELEQVPGAELPPPAELPPAEPRSGVPVPPPSEAREPAVSKEDLEAHRKEEYRRKKEAERLEKEQRRIEREEAERLAREERGRQEREAAEARQREEDERRRRVEAEGGRTLSAGLEKTRGGFMARLNALFTGGKEVDERVLAELEEVLFTADIGVKTATELLAGARERVRKKELSDSARLRTVLRGDIERILALDGRLAQGEGLAFGPQRPYVVMIVGVNGSGKTTTVGKLAAKVKQAGLSVLLGAGDTFRAAAGEQLEIWAERVGAPVVRGKEGTDPASVCFEAVKKGVEEKVDVVLCDTAGRLHTKAPLMEELKKVKRVMAKACDGAPHEVLLVLDATNGQNAIAQARQFHEALGVTGIVLAKLDGTAKGGVVIGICDELKLPVRYVGVGEKVADLRPFEPHEFVEALFAE